MTDAALFKGLTLIFLPWLLGTGGAIVLAYNVGKQRERGRWLELVSVVSYQYRDDAVRGLLRLIDVCGLVVCAGWSRIGRDYPVPTQPYPPPPPPRTRGQA